MLYQFLYFFEIYDTLGEWEKFIDDNKILIYSQQQLETECKSLCTKLLKYALQCVYNNIKKIKIFFDFLFI